MQETIDNLIENSKAAMIAAIEVHNKPVFPYRYEITTVLVVNAWELIFKAYILTNYPDVKVINDDGTTKPFEECLRFISGEIGNDFNVVEESINKVYEYRCNIVHFYSEDIEILIFSLLSPNVIFYSNFLNTHFGIEISEETNLILLPIGFRKPISPIEFLSNQSKVQESSKAVQEFIGSIVDSSKKLQEDGIEDSIFIDYKMAVINEKRIKNADIIAGITKDEVEAKVHVGVVLDDVKVTDDDNAKKIRLEVEDVFNKIYTETYQMVVKYCYANYSDFKKNNDFNAIMKSFKGDPAYHKKRFLDFVNQKGGSKDYYTKAIYDALDTKYTKKEVDDADESV